MIKHFIILEKREEGRCEIDEMEGTCITLTPLPLTDLLSPPFGLLGVEKYFSYVFADNNRVSLYLVMWCKYLYKKCFYVKNIFK
jgi:hypothetical protein